MSEFVSVTCAGKRGHEHAERTLGAFTRSAAHETTGWWVVGDAPPGVTGEQWEHVGPSSGERTHRAVQLQVRAGGERVRIRCTQPGCRLTFTRGASDFYVFLDRWMHAGQDRVSLASLSRYV